MLTCPFTSLYKLPKMEKSRASDSLPSKPACHTSTKMWVQMPSTHVKSQMWLSTCNLSALGVSGQQSCWGFLSARLTQSSVKNSTSRTWLRKWSSRKPNVFWHTDVCVHHTHICYIHNVNTHTHKIEKIYKQTEESRAVYFV